MTRVLNFSGPRGMMRFDLARIALLGAGDGKGDRTMPRVRKEARLLDALDTVSTAAPIEGQPDRRLLAPGDPSVAIGQEDFELLLAYVETAPWMPRVARDAVDLQDWLSASEKRD